MPKPHSASDQVRLLCLALGIVGGIIVGVGAAMIAFGCIVKRYEAHPLFDGDVLIGLGCALVLFGMFVDALAFASMLPSEQSTDQGSDSSG